MNFVTDKWDEAHLYASNVFDLVDNSLAPSTKRTYNGALSKLDKFAKSIGDPIDWTAGVSHNILLNFIGYLWEKSYASSTAQTYLSAVAYIQGLIGAPDITNSFLVSKAMKGYSNADKRQDSRQPISFNLLKSIIAKLPEVCSSIYEVMLFKAAFLLAWTALLRVSEYTARTQSAFFVAGWDYAYLDPYLPLLG